MLIHHHLLFIFEGAHRAPLWAPRSVGPYGLGRAPSPLMHAPVGHAYGCPAGAPIIGRDFSFSFVARPPFGLPALMGALKGTHMHHPSGGALMGHPKGAPYVHPTVHLI